MDCHEHPGFNWLACRLGKPTRSLCVAACGPLPPLPGRAIACCRLLPGLLDWVRRKLPIEAQCGGLSRGPGLLMGWLWRLGMPTRSLCVDDAHLRTCSSLPWVSADLQLCHDCGATSISLRRRRLPSAATAAWAGHHFAAD